MIAPALEELANEYAGKAKVAKVNVDNERNLAAQYGVNAMPTFLLFKGGEPSAQQIGISGGKARLKSMLDAALA
jgi:thioredoxin 1